MEIQLLEFDVCDNLILYFILKVGNKHEELPVTPTSGMVSRIVYQGRVRVYLFSNLLAETGQWTGHFDQRSKEIKELQDVGSNGIVSLDLHTTRIEVLTFCNWT